MSVRCVVVPPGEGAREIVVDGDLEDFQDLVCGYIEAVPWFDDLLVLVDEEGALKRAPLNRPVPEIVYATQDGWLRGPFAFVRERHGSFVSLDDDDVARLLWRFRDPADVAGHRTDAAVQR